MDPKDKEILKDYETSLEDLTFNSKPIINMLTMLAEKHRRLAPQIVELVQSRFFKVAATPIILGTPSCHSDNHINILCDIYLNVMTIFQKKKENIVIYLMCLRYF